jgi:hypothetical protein
MDDARRRGLLAKLTRLDDADLASIAHLMLLYYCQKRSPSPEVAAEIARRIAAGLEGDTVPALPLN